MPDRNTVPTSLRILAEEFDILLDAPGAIHEMRRLVLQLAVQGKLVEQDPNDEPGSRLLQRIATERKKLLKESAIKRIRFAEADEDTAPYKLPDGWNWVSLGAISAKLGAGSTPLGGKSVYVEDGVKFLRSQNVWNDGLRLDSVASIPRKIHEEMAGTHVQPRDVLLNITGASIGRSAVVPDDFDEGNVSQHVAIVRLVDKCVADYIHVCLISPLVQKAIMDVQVGISREGLSMTRLKDFLVPLPPQDEAERIVAKVTQLMSLCDDLEARQQKGREDRVRVHDASIDRLLSAADADEFAEHWPRICDHFDLSYDAPANLTKLRQTILQLAVQGKLVPQDLEAETGGELLSRLEEEKLLRASKEGIDLPEPLGRVDDQEKPFRLPSTWEWARLADVASIKHGFAFKSESFTAEPTPFVVTTPGNFYEKGGFRDRGSKTKYYRGEATAEFILKPGDLIIPMTEQAPGLLGSPAFIPDDERTYLHNQRLGKLDFYSESIAPEFVYWFFNTAFFRQELAKTCTGMKVRHTSPRRVLRVPFPICSRAEQRRIVTKVDDLMSLCDALETQLHSSEATREKLLKSLIHHVANACPAS